MEVGKRDKVFTYNSFQFKYSRSIFLGLILHLITEVEKVLDVMEKTHPLAAFSDKISIPSRAGALHPLSRYPSREPSFINLMILNAEIEVKEILKVEINASRLPLEPEADGGEIQGC